MKKNTVQRNGRKRSPSCWPMAGRATSSRMNTSITSKMFHQRPRGRPPATIRRDSGTKTATMNKATANSSSMNFVRCRPMASKG